MIKTVLAILTVILFSPFESPQSVSSDYLAWQEVPEQSYASCTAYKPNQDITLSDELQEILECPPVLPSIAPNEQFIVYADLNWTAIKTYNLTSGESQEITTFEEGSIDGISFIKWNIDQSKLAMVTVDWEQEQRPELTQLTIFSFEEDGTLLDSTNYDIKINFSCGSANCTPGFSDVIWIHEDAIQYDTWDEVPYDLEFPDKSKILIISP